MDYHDHLIPLRAILVFMVFNLTSEMRLIDNDIEWCGLERLLIPFKVQWLVFKGLVDRSIKALLVFILNDMRWRGQWTW